MAHAHLHLLAGKRILVIANEDFLSHGTRRQLGRLKASIAGPASNLADAVRMIVDGGISAAVVDVRLAGDVFFAVAEKLEDLDLPFVFAITGEPMPASCIYRGFVLSENLEELDKIAKALFAPRSAEDLH
ncbi:response regulator [Rhizobium sp. NTR19]|uniref:Response regulator n=1 Tax=Neorhizobium turbinariae TaxID=2937795 RepID=A0ABT0ISP2_9HYPH|nr:response regulator [Neorhizobium turbinariae]MCK8780899.1 response regulator [Neorhizobium turbinariae]